MNIKNLIAVSVRQPNLGNIQIIDWAVQRIQDLEQENAELKKELSAHQDLLASGILYSYDELTKHDAEVVLTFVAKLAENTYMAVDVDPDFPEPTLVVNYLALQNYVKRLHHKAQVTK